MPNIVDISGGKYHSIIQDREGNAYVAGTNAYGQLGVGNNDESLTFVQIPNFGDIMEISAGNAYTAVAKQDGTVWGFGDYNQGDENFESQTNSNIPVQIGAENFKIEPKKATMYVNATEDLLSALEIKEFNLFYTRNKTAEDYTWESSNESSVEVENGRLTAKAVGVATITATDNITGTKKEIERIVIKEEMDRIKKISINTNEADIVEECKYKIVIEEKDKNGLLTITTTEETDQISLDKVAWSDNGKLTETLNIQDKETDMPFYIQTQNGTVIEYVLKIYVKSHNTELEFIKVNDIEATKKADGTYYIHIDALGEEVSINAKAVDENANIRIESESYELQETTRNKLIDAKETVVNVYVKAEDETVTKYTLLVSGLPDDATLTKVIVNGEEAKYVEGKNKYEIRLSADTYEVQGVASDNLAKVSINEEVAEVSSQTVTVARTEDKTIVKITVTAQNRVDTGEYTLEITQKSSDTEIAYVTVNGKNAEEDEDGNYIAYIKEMDETAEIKAGARDEFAVISLDEETENKNTITATKAVPDKITTCQIKVLAEDGTTRECTLTIKKLSANTNIDTIKVATIKTIEDEETGIPSEVRTEETASMKEDGKYHVKIARENIAEVKVTLEDENASVKIKNSEFELGEITKDVETNAEITEVTITVKAEDDTEKEYILVIEKKSNDTALKEITSEDIQKREDYTIYVDESLEEVDLTFVTRSDLASLKLSSEENYTPTTITRTISLTGEDVEKDSEGTIQVNVEVKAEDGTLETHVIRIVRIGNSNIKEVKVNSEEVLNVNDQYIKEVEGETASVKITAENENSKVQIIKQAEVDGEMTEEVLGTAVGILEIDLPVEEDGSSYKIRITSAAEIVSKDYDLIFKRPIELEASIKGKIITENVSGKHKAKINIYKDESSTVYRAEETNEDGTFDILLTESGNYKLEITKPGYLSYTITDLIIEESKEITIADYYLIAGDVVATGEIEIDDLVSLNDKYGITISEEEDENAIFDLNEDGKIDALDRSVLKANYGKREEIVKWTNY